jgi:hypothetical protein
LVAVAEDVATMTDDTDRDCHDPREDGDNWIFRAAIILILAKGSSKKDSSPADGLTGVWLAGIKGGRTRRTKKDSDASDG